jgi:hypothetical protein
VFDFRFICIFYEMRYTISVVERRISYNDRELNLPKKKTRSGGSFSVIDTDEEFFSVSDLSLSE